MKVTVFGTGYVGLVTGACLSNLGHNVLCIDVNKSVVDSLKAGNVPFFEPNLENLVKKNVNRKRLDFSSDTKLGVEFGEVIFNCVGTPSNKNGECDLKYIKQVITVIAQNIKSYKVVVNKSTVPPGTAKQCYKIMKEYTECEFDIVSNPEFLREGAAVHDFTHPDKIVLGCNNRDAFKAVREVYQGRLRTYLPIIETDWETAELIKYANNCFLATKISFINEMANICDRCGADVKMLSLAMGLDYRINPRFLNAGIGYGGSCFPKDVRALANYAKSIGYNANIIGQVNEFNEKQKEVVFEKMKRVLGKIEGKSICVLGLAFKPNTSDIREAPSIRMLEKLTKAGASIKCYDPEAMEEMKKMFPKAVYAKSAQEAATGADAIVILTEWDEFRNLDLIKLKSVMKGKSIFDGRNIYEPEMVKEDGFSYHGVGR